MCRYDAGNDVFASDPVCLKRKETEFPNVL